MQTIKVTVSTKDKQTDFLIGEKLIGRTYTDWRNKGRYQGTAGNFGFCNNMTFPEVVEFLVDAITNHFRDNYGLNVEFV